MHDIYEWIEKLAQSLPENSSLMLKNALEPVRHRLQDFDEAIFTRPKSNNALKYAATKMKGLAETKYELEATAHILSSLYGYHKQFYPGLVEPKVTWPLRDEPQYIDDNTPHLAVIHELYSILYKETPSSQAHLLDHDTSMGQAILTVVFRSGISSDNDLKRFIQSFIEEWVVIPSQQPVLSLYLPKEKRRFYLMEEAILAMHKVLVSVETMTSNKKNKSLLKYLEAWKCYASKACHPDFSGEIKALSTKELVKFIAFIHQAPVSKIWSNKQVALEDHTFIRAFSGHTVKNETKENNVKVLVDNSSVHWEKTSPLSSKQHKKLRRILSELQKANPKNKRNNKAYKVACNEIQILAKYKTSWRDSLLINWITTLFLHGSPWKDALQPSTLLEYHSTIKSFITRAWPIGDEFEESLWGFEQCCQFGINQTSDSSQQQTIIRFLKYCLEYEHFPNIDIDYFELVSRKKLTRAHYIPPSRFDEICETYEQTLNPTTYPIVLIMQLCYYAGCREDEAVSLYVIDAYFDTGLIYITDRKSRKSSAAVRKIPISMLPSDVLSSLIRHIDQVNRNQADEVLKERKMFEQDEYRVAEQHFINYLRDELKDCTIVTHSLRHCTPNNWIYMLSKIALKTNEHFDPLFCQHELFSSERLRLLSDELKNCGYEITPYFPILYWVSSKLGHSAPSVTITNYLHMLDWISLAVTNRTYPVPARNVRFWTSDSNYGFELAKKLLNDDGYIEQHALNSWVQKHWKNAQHYTVSVPEKKKIEFQATASLLTFNKHLLSINGSETSLSIDNWLSDTRATPTPFAPHQSQHNAWLRLCSAAEDWRELKPNQIKTLKRRFQNFALVVTKRELTNLKELRSVLYAYNCFKLPSITIKVNARKNSKSFQKWKSTIKRYGATPIASYSDVQTNAMTRPHKLRWGLWEDIKAITTLLVHYCDYLEFIQLTESNEKEKP